MWVRFPLSVLSNTQNYEKEHRSDVLFYFVNRKETKMIKETKKRHVPIMNGFIDVKKHFATSNCPIYDVVLYSNLKDYPHAGLLYSKIKFEKVKQILAQGNFKPTPLSESLFEKKFKKK